MVARPLIAGYLLCVACCAGAAAQQPEPDRETEAAAMQRRERVAQRRKGPHVICHRGASEFAHENTLEAYRATFELGADGNEIDIRATKDGVLVCFHDDMLDHILEAYGDVGDYTWEELRRFRFRRPGNFGLQSRIPTLEKVFELHRTYAGLVHLDIKRPGLDRSIAQLLDRFDLWEHVAYCNGDNGGVILMDPRLKLCTYKASLYLDRSEVFPEPIATALGKPGEGLIVDDPRGAIVTLGRKLGTASRSPVAPRAPERETTPLRTEAELLAILADHADAATVAANDEDRRASGQRIVARARAADELFARGAMTPAVCAALEERARNRSLHKEWMFHGLDGAMALRSLILLRGKGAVTTARIVLWRDDAALDPVVDPQYKNPRAWTDFRVKMVVFPSLASLPGKESEQLCRDYLALDDEAARQLGPPQFEQAAKALLAISPTRETAIELMKHRLQAVRGRAILDCLASSDEPWALAALREQAPHALAYVVRP
jgi:hypothetical protein